MYLILLQLDTVLKWCPKGSSVKLDIIVDVHWHKSDKHITVCENCLFKCTQSDLFKHLN